MLRKRFLKYVLNISVLMGFCAMANANVLPTAEDGKVAVDKTIHDFGTIKEDSSNVNAVFTIINTTKVPIILSEVRASCGCTTSEWTKEPIEPGKTGKITATYNPKGNLGPFEKSVTINVSVEDKIQTIVVKVKGTVAE
ncbi:MAG: DUF1573 domain-containing protein [Dysgonamonadaceae bacterium]|nr:DUF1573 domain-containing protein [Dysgonamonadaceae bacterium]